jgi:hypothetical protein
LRIGWDCVTPLESYPTTQSHLFLFIYIHTYFLRGESRRAIYIYTIVQYIYHIRKIFVYLGTVISLHRSRRFLWDAIFSFFFKRFFLFFFVPIPTSFSHGAVFLVADKVIL